MGVFQVWAYDKDTVATLSFLPNYQEQHVKRIPCLTSIQTILNLGTKIWPPQKKMVSKLRLPTIWCPAQIQREARRARNFRDSLERSGSRSREGTPATSTP